ncbi:hypothetical protein NDU88_004946 [Pleurodeles waltl]|uniref:Uncharacterized protein n=1 Tax=Pleurodeles waltl TaxID=8319 RepID=A0AAV7LAY8_PLEWA|nr:hypothetical protein NDU88_004946 [Pleurodeles waltl]
MRVLPAQSHLTIGPGGLVLRGHQTAWTRASLLTSKRMAWLSSSSPLTTKESMTMTANQGGPNMDDYPTVFMMTSSLEDYYDIDMEMDFNYLYYSIMALLSMPRVRCAGRSAVFSCVLDRARSGDADTRPCFGSSGFLVLKYAARNAGDSRATVGRRGWMIWTLEGRLLALG